MNHPPEAAFWHRAARRTAHRLNRAWWLQAFAPLLVLVGAVSFGLIFWRRSRATELDPVTTAAVCVAAVVAAGVAAWWMARRRFVAPESALVALESRLHMNNALSAAEAGRGPWPQIPVAPPDDGFRWSWRWVGGPAAAALTFWLAAFLLPVPRDLEAAAPPLTPPLAWPEMKDWLAKLEEEAVIEPAQIEQLKEKLDELQSRPEKEWYSHESLEATDALRQSLDRSIQQMGADLDTAERSLNALDNLADQLTAEAKDQMAADFQAALGGLSANELKLDPELMKKLGALDPKNLKSLSQAQLKELREAMKKNAGACKACQNPGEGPGFLGDGKGSDDEEMQALMKLLTAQGKCIGGANPGKGGVNRGPGAAPLFLSDTESKLGTNKQEAVTNEELSRAVPADLIGLGQQEHELDTSPVGARAGGAADTGQGGERVWKDDLTPAERAVLKRYFK